MARRGRSWALVMAVVAAVAVAALVLEWGAPAAQPPPSGPVAGNLPAGVDVVVERVVDGDTIVVTGRRTVRLIGIDTPETVDPRRPVACFGEEASRFMSSLLPPGTAVRLVGDVEQEDRYGRLLAYVYRREDGLFVNAELVRQGYATVYTVTPNVAHADQFEAAAREARVGVRGLWAACSDAG
ncbi:MAG: thermonuclease family protein [Actinomycetota bacterium]